MDRAVTNICSFQLTTTMSFVIRAENQSFALVTRLTSHPLVTRYVYILTSKP